VRGELLVVADERAEALVASSSGSNVIPSGARSISMPDSVTRRRRDVDVQHRRSAAGGPPDRSRRSVGSKPLRSVKRHDSSFVVGSGSAR
jgi:hypothetical protein